MQDINILLKTFDEIEIFLQNKEILKSQITDISLFMEYIEGVKIIQNEVKIERLVYYWNI
jgi:hypothetical protein